MEYRDTTKNMRQIGEELGVVYLLEGRVQRAGNRLHIIIQLIDATSDEHVWQDTYDRELTAENIFALQAEMATSIATELHQTLSPEMTAKLNEQPYAKYARIRILSERRPAYLKRQASGRGDTPIRAGHRGRSNVRRCMGGAVPGTQPDMYWDGH